jgi:hypothetical protein
MFHSINTTSEFFLDLCYGSCAYTSLWSEGLLQRNLVYFPFLPAGISFIHFHHHFTVTLNVQLHPDGNRKSLQKISELYIGRSLRQIKLHNFPVISDGSRLSLVIYFN